MYTSRSRINQWHGFGYLWSAMWNDSLDYNSQIFINVSANDVMMLHRATNQPPGKRLFFILSPQKQTSFTDPQDPQMLKLGEVFNVA